MFSSITSYLFGAAEPDSTQDEPVTNNGESQQRTQTSEQPKTETTLQTRQEEDEWILVDKSEMRHGKRLRPHSPLEARKRMHHSDNTESITDSTNTYSPQETCHFQESLPRDHIDSHDEDSPDRGEPHDTSDSDMSTVAYPMMEESWLVTPPACFTAGTSKMETSSMENLLIEHPSMSVYHHRGRQSSTGLDSDNSESSNDGESGGVTRSQAGLARHQPSHRPRALVGRAGLNQVKTAVRSMQQSQQRNLYKSLSHNNLRRANLTQHSQGKVTRKHTVHQPSARHIRTNIKQC